MAAGAVCAFALRTNHLSKLLADNYSLYLKTHSFHWNVTGPMFNSLHLMFEGQYNELWLANDVIAERIRALDVMAPGSYSQFGKLTSIKEETGAPEWKEMVAQLVAGHETAARTARETIKVADKADDQPTADLATQRVEAHEKTAWMLRCLLNYWAPAAPIRDAVIVGTPGLGNGVAGMLSASASSPTSVGRAENALATRNPSENRYRRCFTQTHCGISRAHPAHPGRRCC